jgi:hypothetical protein
MAAIAAQAIQVGRVIIHPPRRHLAIGSAVARSTANPGASPAKRERAAPAAVGAS